MDRGLPETVFCKQCGFVHLRSRPTAAELAERYTDEYYQTYYKGQYAKEQREWWYWEWTYYVRWARFYKYSMMVEHGVDWPVLDYGCGFGWFGRANWERRACFGVEPNTVARKLSQIYYNRVFEPVDVWCAAPYVGIHMSLVLEHLLDPRRVLRRALRYLVPGGALCVVVPNEFNPLQRELAEQTGYSPVSMHHVNYFTPETLVVLLTDVGFEIKEKLATFPMEWFALHGLNYVKYPWMGRIAHWIRMWIETRTAYVTDAQRMTWYEKGIGREIEIWATRPLQ